MSYSLRAMKTARQKALTRGERLYFTGRPCRKGHIGPRLATTGVCVTCKHERRKSDAKRWREANGLSVQDVIEKFTKP